jgi:hypothetical protein
MSWLRTILSMPMWLKDVIGRRIKKTALSENISLAPGASDGGFSFEPQWINKRSSLFSRSMVKTVSKSRMAAKRRRNYLALHQALSELPGCRALFSELPDGVVPWVYPLVSDNLRTVFPILKNAGVPIIRFGEYLWPGVDSEVCAASVELSQSVMQFPCHQDLREEELNWMIEKVRSVILTKGMGIK